ERRAGHPRVVLGANGAAVQLDEMPDDGEPEPQASVRPRGAGSALTEALEYVWQEVGGDAGAVVAHRDRHAVGGSREVDVDAAAGRREAHCVRQQIPDHLLQPAAIAADDQLPRSTV